jgi:hypothetical protein
LSLSDGEFTVAFVRLADILSSRLRTIAQLFKAMFNSADGAT